jgi:hypothetical protein
MLLAYTPTDRLEGILISLASGALKTVVRQEGVALGRDGGDEVVQAWRRDGLAGRRVSLSIGKRAGAFDGDTHVELAFCCTDCGTSDGEGAVRRGLDRFLPRLVACRLRQAAAAMPLKATGQRRSGQVQPRGWHGRQAVIQGQPRLLAEYDHARFFFPVQPRGAGLLRSPRDILHTRALLPLGNGLGMHIIAVGKLG